MASAGDFSFLITSTTAELWLDGVRKMVPEQMRPFITIALIQNIYERVMAKQSACNDGQSGQIVEDEQDDEEEEELKALENYARSRAANFRKAI